MFPWDLTPHDITNIESYITFNRDPILNTTSAKTVFDELINLKPVHSDLIHIYASYLSNHCVNFGYWESDVFDSIDNSKKKWKGLFSKKSFVLFINHQNVHYSAAAFLPIEKRIEYYDSLGSDLCSNKKEKIMNACKSATNFEYEWRDCTLDKTFQIESYNCSIFVCYVAFQYAIGIHQDKFFHYYNSNFMERFRIALAEFFFPSLFSEFKSNQNNTTLEDQSKGSIQSSLTKRKIEDNDSQFGTKKTKTEPIGPIESITRKPKKKKSKKPKQEYEPKKSKQVTFQSFSCSNCNKKFISCANLTKHNQKCVPLPNPLTKFSSQLLQIMNFGSVTSSQQSGLNEKSIYSMKLFPSGKARKTPRVNARFPSFIKEFLIEKFNQGIDGAHAKPEEVEMEIIERYGQGESLTQVQIKGFWRNYKQKLQKNNAQSTTKDAGQSTEAVANLATKKRAAQTNKQKNAKKPKK